MHQVSGCPGWRGDRVGGLSTREPPVTAPTSPPPGFPHGRCGFFWKCDGGSPQVGHANLTVRDRAGRTLCCYFHSLVTAPRSGQKGARLPSVTLASLLFVCACRTSLPSQPPIPAVLPEQSQPPGLPEQSPAAAPGLPQPPLPACILPGPPRTAHRLPGPPLAQCPGPLLLHFFLLCFISRAGCPPLPSFYPRNFPPPPPCAPQPPEFARGPS